MVDNPELIDRYEAKLQELLTHMHNDGISPSTILFIFSETIKSLELKLYASESLKKAP